MKKIFLSSSLLLVFGMAFSQTAIFQENFDKGVLSDAWKINSGRWYVANLQEKDIKPPPGDNNFALASGGNGEIFIDIPFENTNPATPLQLSFTYWVHSLGSTGMVSLLFLNSRADSLKSMTFEGLPEKGKWDVFNQQFNVPKGTSMIRLRLGERSAAGRNTVYFKALSLGGRRR